ncbi:5-(carboxyamino)imidazole ribonucleotide mutase [Kangiella koreensis]|uniref:N5-carboxyaminoimidazole ribonucleotide mutase n=1 Tax=Kangiella koreensis (strain DSM 16069 / JCM 12317 / KCTC 12182 / SW-125) TaxID=523791 RepID=C7R912_KANKD|nr:5-(carboxyamino)imidazole ribonucleotide mutase [Kangiella koreensis]ACV27802.1 phosphoribosylaminoimidazole carboxylase, catalytic subunit [Kangiella koreensis DSM 16069]
MSSSQTTPKVSIIMGSQSDWNSMQHATTVLDELDVAYETKIVSAHRTPNRLYQFCDEAAERGIEVIIAGAGGSAHLAGMAAAMTWLPVIAVPMSSKQLKGMDSLLSMVQMPKGVAVACQAIGDAGAFNGGLLAAQILSLHNPSLRKALQQWRAQQTASVAEEVAS